MNSRLPCKGCTRPRPRGDVRTQMETPPHSKPLKAKTFSLVTLLLCLPLVEGNASPHQVHRITWRVFNTETGNTVNETTGIGPIATYFPTLTVDLGESWDPSPQEPFPGYGCQHPGWRVKTRGHDFYVCPGHSRGRIHTSPCEPGDTSYSHLSPGPQNGSEHKETPHESLSHDSANRSKS